MTDHMGPVDTQVIEHALDVPDQREDVVRLDALGLVRRPEPPQVGGDDPVAGIDQGGDLVPPHVMAVGPSVQQDHRRSVTFDGHVQADAIGLYAHSSSSWSGGVKIRLAGPDRGITRPPSRYR